MLIYSNIFYYQVAINIFKGIQDKDARYLAEKLEFKGPLLEKVCWQEWVITSLRKPSCLFVILNQWIAIFICAVHLTFWLFTQAAEQIKLLYELFLKVDATQVEINPFGETPDGKGILYYPRLIAETSKEEKNL